MLEKKLIYLLLLFLIGYFIFTETGRGVILSTINKIVNKTPAGYSDPNGGGGGFSTPTETPSESGNGGGGAW